MNTSSVYHRIIIFLIFSFAPVLWMTSLAQDSGTLNPDSTAMENIDMADISIMSSETILEIKQLSGKLIKDADLQHLKSENDSLVKHIDSLLQKDMNKTITWQSKRELVNKLIFWSQQNSILDEEMSEITSALHDLDDSKYSLSKESSLWNKARTTAEEGDMAKEVKDRIDKVLHTVDTTMNTVNKKGKIVLILYDNSSKLGVEIETWTTRIKKEILNKQQQLLKTNQPSLFTVDYTKNDNWDITSSLNQFYRVDLKNLASYLGSNIGSILVNLLIIALLIALFIKIKKTKLVTGKDEAAFYKRRFRYILARPTSAALIVGIFASVFIFADRPLVFVDMTRLFVIFPIVLVLIGILHRRYHMYIYGFGFINILQIIYLNLSSESIISRYILITIGIIEVVAILHFIMYYRRRSYKNNGTTKFILILCYMLLAMAGIGLFGDILGKVMLAEYLLFAVIGVALVAILIGLSLIAINGLVVMFIDSKYTDNLRVLRKNRNLVIHKTIRILNILGVVLLIYYILKVLGWDISVIDGITDWFTKERNIGSMLFSWWTLVIFLVVIWLSIIVSKIIRAVLEDDVLQRMKLEKGLPHTIAMVVRYTLVTLGIFLAVSAAGLPMSEFAIIFGAFGVGIGFGLQNIFNNLVSGLILLFERPIKIGDTIEVGTLMGNVKSIGIRSSNVRTFDGAEIIVPNGNLISNEVINWTLSDQTRRIEVIVGVSYSSDPHQVHDILLKVLKDHKNIVKNPEPNVLFKELGDSSLNFRMLSWTPQFDQWIRIKSEILFAVFDELKAAGIEIPFPQQDIHLRSIDKDAGIILKNSNPKEK